MLGVRLANKLEEGSAKKIAEFVSFQSELRVLPPAEAAGLSEFTGVATPVTTPPRAARWCVALMSTPTAIRPGPAWIAEPMEPSVSARTTDAPPWSRP